MSLDYYLWRGPRLTEAEFEERLRVLDEGDVDEESLFTPSDRLGLFRREVLRRHPPLEDRRVTGADTPWAMTPIASRTMIQLNIRASTDSDQVLWIIRCALRNGLYVYDAQGPNVYRPGPARWQLWLRKVGLTQLAGPDP